MPPERCKKFITVLAAFAMLAVSSASGLSETLLTLDACLRSAIGNNAALRGAGYDLDLKNVEPKSDVCALYPQIGAGR